MKVKQLILFVALLLVAACANRVTPTGGPKDVKPPDFGFAIPPNSSINFKSKEIMLNFNEYVQLKDIATQLLISPLIEPRPEVKVNKRAVVVKFSTKLKDSTTYTINFGKAIEDLHEGNPILNFQYVFSTGPILDSLKCNGIIREASSNNPLKDITVMLYRKSGKEEKPDSLVYKIKPDYFAHTTETGNFEIGNIAPGDYFIYALDDKNSDYLLDDFANERMGYTDKIISIPQKDSIVLRVSFQYPGKKQFLKAQVNDHLRATLIFNQHIDSLSVRDLYSKNIYSGKMEWSQKKDSLIVFAKDTISDSLNLLINSAPFINDTIQLQMGILAESKRKSSNNKLKLAVLENPERSGPFSKFKMELSRPLEKVSAPLLFVDSIPVPEKDYSISRDSLSSRIIYLDHKWKQGSNYKLIFLPGSLTDIYGITNDSIILTSKIPTPETTSSLTVSAINLTEGGNYLLQVLNDKMQLIKQKVIQKSGKYTIDFIPTGSYIIRIVNDANNNAEWDPADYAFGIEPEQVVVSNVVQLRANWELELEVNCNSLK